MMRHYALVGEHLGHSLSIPIHEAIFRRLGLEADYKLIEIPRGQLAQALPALLASLDGFNVTIPYKQEIMPWLTSLDELSASVGAVNTVAVSGAQARGYNTDVIGCMAMLTSAGIDPSGSPAYILGTGGASMAAEAALKRLGASQVHKVSRHPAAGQISYAQLAQAPGGVIVNCTPAGMFPDVDGCALDEGIRTQVLQKALGVADMIYNPAETVLTGAAKRLGVPAVTGMNMLVRQAVETERIWQGLPLGEDMTQELLKEMARK